MKPVLTVYIQSLANCYCYGANDVYAKIYRILRSPVCRPAQLECLFVRPPAYSAGVCVFVCPKNLILKLRFLKEYPMKKN